jgi:hypothetical protein
MERNCFPLFYNPVSKKVTCSHRLQLYNLLVFKSLRLLFFTFVYHFWIKKLLGPVKPDDHDRIIALRPVILCASCSK